MAGRNSHVGARDFTREKISEIMLSLVTTFCCTFKWDPATVLGTLKMDEYRLINQSIN